MAGALSEDDIVGRHISTRTGSDSCLVQRPYPYAIKLQVDNLASDNSIVVWKDIQNDKLDRASISNNITQ